MRKIDVSRRHSGQHTQRWLIFYKNLDWSIKCGLKFKSFCIAIAKFVKHVHIWKTPKKSPRKVDKQWFFVLFCWHPQSQFAITMFMLDRRERCNAAVSRSLNLNCVSGVDSLNSLAACNEIFSWLLRSRHKMCHNVQSQSIKLESDWWLKAADYSELC